MPIGGERRRGGGSGGFAQLSPLDMLRGGNRGCGSTAYSRWGWRPVEVTTMAMAAAVGGHDHSVAATVTGSSGAAAATVAAGVVASATGR